MTPRIADLLRHPPSGVKREQIKIAIVAITDHRGRVLVVRRPNTESSRPGEWETVGGHVDKGETPEDAAIREAKEESGLDITLEPGQSWFTLRDGEGFGICFKAVVRDGSEFHLKRDEHDAYKWIRPRDLKHLHPVPPDFVKVVRAVTGSLKMAQRAKRENPHGIVEHSQAVYQNLDDSPSRALWGLGQTEHPDFTLFEEVDIPQQLDEVFQRLNVREPGDWGQNHWGAKVHDNLLQAVDEVGLRHDANVVKLGDGNALVTVSSVESVPKLKASLRKRGFTLRKASTQREIVVALPVVAFLRHRKDGWHVYSKRGKHLGGPYSRKQAVKRLHQIEYFGGSRDATGFALPLQSVDPNKTLQQQLGSAGMVAPTTTKINGITTPTIETTNPKQTMQKVNQLVQNNQVSLAPQSKINTTIASLRQKPWFRGVTTAKGVLRVRVACGCDGPLGGPVALPERLNGIPIHLVLLFPGNIEHEIGNAQKIEVKESKVASRVAKPRTIDPDQGSLFDVEEQEPGIPQEWLPDQPENRRTPVVLQRGLKLKEDLSYRNRYMKLKQALEELKTQNASQAQLFKLTNEKRKALKQWKNHLKSLRTGPRRDPRWTSIQGLTRAAEEFLQKMGGDQEYVNWYDRHRKWVEDKFAKDREWGGGPEVFYKFLASTSPNSAVEANVSLAKKAYEHWKESVLEGRAVTFEQYISAHKSNLYRTIEGEELSGPKVNPFSKAMLGEPSPAVVDLWMGRMLFGIDKPTRAQIRKAQEVIAKIAHNKGWDIHYTQGLLWEMIRDHWGEKPADFLVSLKKKFSGDKQLRMFATSSRRATLNEKDEKEIVAGLGMLIDQYGQSTSPVCGAKQHTIRSLPQRPKSVIHVGDWVELENRDGTETKGFVDRVAPDHVWVRPWPAFAKGKIQLQGIDWRDRKDWHRLVVRHKGQAKGTVYKHYVASRKNTTREAAVRSALYTNFGATDGFFAGLGEGILNAADEYRYKKEKRIVDRRKRSKNKKAGATPTEMLPEPTQVALQEGRVNDFDSLLFDLTFSTSMWAHDDAWREINRVFKRAFPGLGPEDFKYIHERWRGMRKHVSSRRSPEQVI